MTFGILQILNPLRISVNSFYVSLRVPFIHTLIGHFQRPIEPLIVYYTRIYTAIVVSDPTN